MVGCGGAATNSPASPSSPPSAAPDAAHIVFSPAALDFGAVPVGVQKTSSVTVSNSHGTSSTISQITATGAGFSVISAPALPLILSAGQSSTVTVAFRPTSAGAAGGSFVISFSGTTPSISDPLSGSGVAAGQLGVAPSAMAFGNVLVGSSRNQAGSLTAGSSGVTVSSGNVNGAGYSLSGITFPVTIAAGQSVPFTVTFAPQTASSSTGSLSFVSNASNSPATETLSGTGIAAGQLSVSPTAMAFGNVLVGSSQTQTGSLTAAGAGVTVSSAGWNGAGYSFSGIVFPVTIPAGQSIPFAVTFAPQTAGSSTGSVAFFSNASNSPVTETLSGSGLQAAHSVSLSWNASTSAVAGYNIYRGSQSGGPYTRLNSSVQPGTTYADNNVQSGATYFYVVTAVDASSQESILSNESMAIIPVP